MHVRSAACFLAIGCLLVPHAQATNFSETFNGAETDGLSTIFTHDGSGFLPGGASPVSTDVPSTNAFTGAGGGAAGSLVTNVGYLLDAGLGGAGDDVAAIEFVDAGTNGFTYGGLEVVVGSLSDPSAVLDLVASVDVLAPAGVPLQLRVESPFTSQNNGFFLDFVGTGSFETISGVLGTDFAATGSFVADSPTVTLVVATRIGGAAPVGETTRILVNNASLREVPEPTAAALAALGLAGFAERRRG